MGHDTRNNIKIAVVKKSSELHCADALTLIGQAMEKMEMAAAKIRAVDADRHSELLQWATDLSELWTEIKGRS